MKRFIIDVVAIIVATIICNVVYQAIDVVEIITKYPEPQFVSPAKVPEPTPTRIIVEKPTIIVNNSDIGRVITLEDISIRHVCSSLEDKMLYYNADYTRFYKDKMLKDKKCWYASFNSKAEILEHNFPYVKIKILTTAVYEIGNLWAIGWIRP